MNTDERTRHIINGAFKLAAAEAQKGGLLTTGQVSTWVSIAQAIVKETEARMAEGKPPPPAKLIAAVRPAPEPESFPEAEPGPIGEQETAT